MPKVRLEVRKVGSETSWHEEYDNCVGDPIQWGQSLVARYNATLRPGEHPRELVGVEVLDEKTKYPHDWEKTNFVTIMRGGTSYDAFRCKKCGVTGKRHGLGTPIRRDSAYKAKKYESCTEA